MKPIIRVFAVLLIVGAAVFWVRSQRTPAAEIVDEFRAESGVTFTECGDERCVEAAESNCAPTHFEKTVHTIEGVPVKLDLFMLQQVEGCRVLMFADYTKDYWGGCVLRQQTCPTVSAILGNDPMHHGCEESTVVFTAPSCEVWQ